MSATKVLLSFPQNKQYLVSFTESIVKLAPTEKGIRKLYVNIWFLIGNKLAEPPKDNQPSDELQRNQLLIDIPEWDDFDFRKSYLSPTSQMLVVDYIQKAFVFVFYSYMMQSYGILLHKIAIQNFIETFNLDPDCWEMLKKAYYRYRKGVLPKKTIKMLEFLKNECPL